MYTNPLQLVYSDLWGPSPVLSSSGYRYYIHFIDAYSRFTWLYLLRAKSEALQAFVNFKTLVEKQIGLPVKCIQTDRGGKFRAFTDLLVQHGVEHRHPWYTYT